jgi:hypothetical protein
MFSTNLFVMKTFYFNIWDLSFDISQSTVQSFYMSQRYLNAERLMTLMIASNSNKQISFYLQTILQILQKMTREQKFKSKIDYIIFKNRILSKSLSSDQLASLSLCLNSLKSFIEVDNNNNNNNNNDWIHHSENLTIVDLSCSFVDSDIVCELFDMCLDVFLEQRMNIDRVIVLNEAHKVEFSLYF